MDAENRAHLAALAGFDHMTTSRLVALLSGRAPIEAYAMASGCAAPSAPVAGIFRRSKDLGARWKASAAAIDPGAMEARCADLGVRVLVPEDAEWPPQLMCDPRRPAVLFAQGDPDVLDGRRVGIVGTRNPTRRGAQSAARFGSELATAGVRVVSGLALGVDGAAHRGALAADGAPPIAVVANGHDQPYPRQHRSLWMQVAEAGVVLSEWPPGTRPEPFRFPQRNRILAALSELVVVVESRERGGSLITAREAAERGVDVFAVPGPIDQRSSVGTNRLLEDGATPVASTDTLLVALGLDHRRAGRRRFDARALPRGDEAVVMDLCRSEPQSVESVAIALDWELAHAAMALARLERSGWLGESGGWFEEVDEYAELAE
ncbi:DNA-processing protein DprA [Ilumatobacter nonamiensis]|uniref:DNA-processing protein DprA n=1 Tax=Ilumatobacter nonamiensis TaxID=467093 RepID=UPI0003497880|nr:DNA-processing protein DprA [Ilumatobacter nonamiensis]